MAEQLRLPGGRSPSLQQQADRFQEKIAYLEAKFCKFAAQYPNLGGKAMTGGLHGGQQVFLYPGDEILGFHFTWQTQFRPLLAGRIVNQDGWQAGNLVFL